MNASVAATARPTGQSIVNPDGSTNRIWLSSYVKGVPHDIDVNKYQSLGQYFDECINKYRQRPGFVSIGTEMSFDRLDRLVTASMGLIELPQDNNFHISFTEAYESADKLLYDAKSAGRNAPAGGGRWGGRVA